MPVAHVAPVAAPPRSASPASPWPPHSWEPSGEERRKEIIGRKRERKREKKRKGKEKGKKKGKDNTEIRKINEIRVWSNKRKDVS
jgi:hypothetical protein